MMCILSYGTMLYTIHFLEIELALTILGLLPIAIMVFTSESIERVQFSIVCAVYVGLILVLRPSVDLS